MSDAGDWTTSAGARAQFMRLVQESGVVLENNLAEQSAAFAKTTTKRKGVRVRAESVAYGDDTSESPLRQLDQVVQFYKEFVFDERTGIQLIMTVPVEAKFRRDVEACAVRYPTGSYRPALPLLGTLHGSQLARALRTVVPFAKYPLAQPVLVEVEKGSMPKRVFGENLVFNAGAALYDYIHHQNRGTDQPFGQAFIVKSKLLERFSKYIDSKRYAWWSVIHAWMKENLTPVLASEFNRIYLPTRVHFGVNVYVPVLFVNGRILDGGSGASEPPPTLGNCEAVVTRVRVPRWPGPLRRHLIGYTAEAPLLLTNPAGLPEVLAECLDAFLVLESTLKQHRAAFGDRWPIEAAFYQTALQHFLGEDDGALRSDLDIFQWLHQLPKTL